MSTDSSSESNVNIGSIAGGTIGAVLFILICAIVFYCVRVKQSKFSPVQSKVGLLYEEDIDMIPETEGRNPALVDAHDVLVTSYEI